MSGEQQSNRELQIVGFRVGNETYGVPITALHEIVRVPEITAVPDAPEYMEGVINLRGKIVSVIDLRKRFGIKDASPSRRNRILVVEFNGRLSGLIVDSASEVLKIPAADVEPPPAVLHEGGGPRGGCPLGKQAERYGDIRSGTGACAHGSGTEASAGPGLPGMRHAL